MLIIIVIAAIALILIIPGKKKSKKNDYSGDETVKTSKRTNFLSVIGLCLRNIKKGK